MVLKGLILCILVVIILLILRRLLPKLIHKYKVFKELKETRKKQIAFKNKMKELEIK